MTTFISFLEYIPFWLFIRIMQFFNFNTKIFISAKVISFIIRNTPKYRKRVLKKSSELTFELPHNLQKYVCKKGSIAIDGISLTVNNVEEKSFSVSIIPHTSAVTTLGSIKKDDIVNIEIDILARYIDNNIKKIK